MPSISPLLMREPNPARMPSRCFSMVRATAFSRTWRTYRDEASYNGGAFCSGPRMLRLLRAALGQQEA